MTFYCDFLFPCSWKHFHDLARDPAPIPGVLNHCGVGLIGPGLNVTSSTVQRLSLPAAQVLTSCTGTAIKLAWDRPGRNFPRFQQTPVAVCQVVSYDLAWPYEDIISRQVMAWHVLGQCTCVRQNLALTVPLRSGLFYQRFKQGMFCVAVQGTSEVHTCFYLRQPGDRSNFPPKKNQRW